ncbi:peroxisomal membrane protein [Seminavis robusta]|uniref:Peroxisomal membrane protein n=1 Tax=Seminavis robusta TaxID=568900 RepID=A0A9N8EHW1_9STRA|nr:peroxisomal membrane protein [Seminavis robusta]|eukprot:Sro1159_g247620.1 peroxisomal membrane protein (226) ;mRNA; f:23121-23886
MDPAASFNFDGDDDKEELDSDLLEVPSSPKPGNPLKILLKGYQDRLEKNPLVTKSITCACVSALGSLLSHVNDNNPQGPSPSGNKPPTATKLQQLAEIAAFALYGGLVGGPLTHFWNQWLEREAGSTSWKVLVDQLIAQPPMLFLMHVVLDMAGAAVQELPKAWNRSLQKTGQSVVMSWRFWPLAVYIITRFAKKERHLTIGTHVAALYWMSKIARQRSNSGIRY